MDLRVFASQNQLNQLGLHLIALLKDQRQPDKLRTAKPLVRRLLQTKQAIPPELAELLLSCLDKWVRSNKVGFEQCMEHFLSCLSIVIEEPGSKLIDSAYRLFYQILLLPLQSKDRKQLLNDKAYFQIYDAVRMDKNDQIQRRYLILIKLILDIVHETTPTDPHKLFNLLRKASQKYENAQIVNVLFAFYVSRIQMALLGQETKALTLKSLGEMSKTIVLKYKNQATQVINKMILLVTDGAGSSLLPGICVYLLIQAAKKELIIFYLTTLADEKGFGGRLVMRIRETIDKIGEIILDISQFELPITDKRQKLKLQQLLLILVASVLSKIFENQQHLDQLLKKCVWICKQAGVTLDDIISSILLTTYLQGWDFICGQQIRFSGFSVSSTCWVLIYFFIRNNQTSLSNYICTVIRNRLQCSEILNQLGYLSQHSFIVQQISRKQLPLDTNFCSLLVDYFNSITSYELCDQLRLSLYKRLCDSNKIQELIERGNNESMSIKSLKASPQTTILRIQQSVINKYFNNQLRDADRTAKFLSTVSVGDTLMSGLLDLIFVRLLCLKQSVITTVKEKHGFLDSSYRLMEEINFTVLDDVSLVTVVQHPWIEKSLKLVAGLKPTPSALKRVIGLRFDRPSEYTIRKDILPNRFFLKCVQLGDMKNLLKNILEVINKAEEPDDYLKVIFQDLPREVRVKYMKYLTTRNIAEFRLFLLDYPLYMHLAE